MGIRSHWGAEHTVSLVRKTKTMKFEKWNLKGQSRSLACAHIVGKTRNVTRVAHEYRGLDHIQRPS